MRICLVESVVIADVNSLSIVVLNNCDDTKYSKVGYNVDEYIVRQSCGSISRW